ncbi:MAG: hypothetical protein ALECFALPRED_003804 [Alectoria fallacina]|uniref:Uncharacterized protein n=1 Tax=Alectoria fallacina TaxID=1903189 RepID=A0A8H3FNA2_9LECA|nr:MAG: hypothetical protein ALECFALPRED_003804 [Alectoria fallacina]
MPRPSPLLLLDFDYTLTTTSTLPLIASVGTLPHLQSQPAPFYLAFTPKICNPYPNTPLTHAQRKSGAPSRKNWLIQTA